MIESEDDKYRGRIRSGILEVKMVPLLIWHFCPSITPLMPAVHG